MSRILLIFRRIFLKNYLRHFLTRLLPYIPALENKPVLSDYHRLYGRNRFFDNDAGDYIYVDASIDEFYLYDADGNFKDNESFSRQIQIRTSFLLSQSLISLD